MDIKKNITFKNMDKSDVMLDYANEQLARIEEFLLGERAPIFIELVLESSKLHEHPKIELRVKSPYYDECIANEYDDGTPFYDALDNAIDTMYRNLHEAKRRLGDEKKTVGRHEEFKKQR